MLNSVVRKTFLYGREGVHTGRGKCTKQESLPEVIEHEVSEKWERREHRSRTWEVVPSLLDILENSLWHGKILKSPV